MGTDQIVLGTTVADTSAAELDPLVEGDKDVVQVSQSALSTDQVVVESKPLVLNAVLSIPWTSEWETFYRGAIEHIAETESFSHIPEGEAALWLPFRKPLRGLAAHLSVELMHPSQPFQNVRVQAICNFDPTKAFEGRVSNARINLLQVYSEEDHLAPQEVIPEKSPQEIEEVLGWSNQDLHEWYKLSIQAAYPKDYERLTRVFHIALKIAEDWETGFPEGLRYSPLTDLIIEKYEARRDKKSVPSA